jgi:serine/threonine-protein kinase RsbT
MVTLSKQTMVIVKEIDVIPFRNSVKECAVKTGMGLVNQTKVITAASELARNMLKYAKGGIASIEVVMRGKEVGLKLVFADEGPGISDIGLAMKDGYSTGKSLGLGLPGTKRLVSDFQIESVMGKGTTVTITKWKNG